MDKMKSNGSDAWDSEDSVHSVEKSLPNSRKVYLNGKLHPEMRVPSFVIPREVEGSLTISVRI
jgi:hypothetical protein